MKNGFSMIELIFVIVILGILAAVAVPKLAAVNEEKELKESQDANKTQTTPRGKTVKPVDSKFPHTIYSAPQK